MSRKSRSAKRIVVGALMAVFAIAGEALAEPSVERDVEYARRSDQELLADIYTPKGDGPFPGVLMVHGGAWMSGNKSHVAGHAQRLMRRGYVVVAINYRLAPRHKFPSQVEDCRAALRWMRTHSHKYRIDPLRIAGYGYSAGGQLVCLLGLCKSANEQERLQAVVAGGAPCEFRMLPKQSKTLAYWLGGTRDEKPNAYRDASPNSFVSPDDPPVFFFHGERDRLVQPSSSRELYQRLKQQGVPTEMHIVADAGHLQAFFDLSATDRAAEFLDSVFRPKDQEQLSP